ncbi:MAG: PucR family transcriptional regulator ligand-binding domain-containing protein [Megasphaera sp.]|uniref:PucR family transcriptional regulator n=1 Tax=Megasphaera sueciensis TaxID=349094 RepID=UPI003D06DCF8|nr:PucR family transcriptional regulator ligand-binding domain-containing protein [Megasphaera sp.]MCI1822326.1 PucR family transcriptional regulator ligand-binding domain-containing protein [Megasphaera sp.]
MSFTVRKALQMDHMKDAELIGGSGGLDRIISCVDISETPDSYEWLRPNEFLITTGYSIRDNLESQMKLLRSLSQKQGAALAIKFGRFIGSIPQELVGLSDELDIPLISLPNNLPFIDITYPLMQRIVNNQARQLAYSEKIYKMLTKVALETNSLESISSALESILAKKVIIYPYNLRASSLNTQHQQVIPVQVKKRVYGYIVVNTPEPLSDKELIAVQHAEVLVALHLVNYELATEAAWNERRDLLDDLISGKIHSMALLQARADEFSFSLEGEKCVCIVDIDDFTTYLLQHDLTEQQALTFRRSLFHCVQGAMLRLGKCNRNFLTAQQSDKVIILGSFYQTDWESVLPEIHTQVSQLSEELTATIVISNPVNMLAEIQKAYETARRLIGISRKIHGPGKDLYQKDAELYLILEKMDAASLDSALLGKILKSRKRKEYLRTLQVYLDCQGNLSEAAQLLFIHRNTLRYRLKQIELLLGKKLDDPEIRVILWLLLKSQQLQ